MMQKAKVVDNFSSACRTYDSVANIQKECTGILANMLHDCLSCQPNTVLDIGTGTGFLAEEFAKYFSNSKYYLNDISKDMLEYAIQKLQHLDVEPFLGDIENVKLKQDYDIIMSNLAMQWISDLPSLLLKLNQHSKTIGFSTLIQGTFANWYEFLKEYGIKQPFELKTYKQIEDCVLSLKGFKQFKMKVFPLQFESAIDVIHYLKKLGASGDNSNRLPKKLLEDKRSLKLEYHVMFATVSG